MGSGGWGSGRWGTSCKVRQISTSKCIVSSEPSALARVHRALLRVDRLLLVCCSKVVSLQPSVSGVMLFPQPCWHHLFYRLTVCNTGSITFVDYTTGS